MANAFLKEEKRIRMWFGFNFNKRAAACWGRTVSALKAPHDYRVTTELKESAVKRLARKKTYRPVINDGQITVEKIPHKETRGGYRPNAGRPHLHKKKEAFYLPKDVSDFIKDRVDAKSDFVVAALRAHIEKIEKKTDDIKNGRVKVEYASYNDTI